MAISRISLLATGVVAAATLLGALVPARDLLTRSEAESVLTAVQTLRAEALTTAAPSSGHRPLPNQMTGQMRAALTGDVMRIRAAASREAAIDSYAASHVSVSILKVQAVSSGATVAYRLDAVFDRPAPAVAHGSPATMEMSSERVAHFVYDPSAARWLVNAEGSAAAMARHARSGLAGRSDSEGIPDALDMAAQAADEPAGASSALAPWEPPPPK